MFNNIVTIQKKDKNTGEIKENYSSKNSQTLGSIRKYLNGGDVWWDELLSDDYDSGPPRGYILAKEMDLENTINEATRNIVRFPGQTHKLNQITGTVQPSVTIDTANKTVEVEFNGRLNPPSSGTRSITSIQLGTFETDVSLNEVSGFGVVLDSPCTQSDTEILDVFYRVRITGNPYYSNDYYWITYLPMKLNHIYYNSSGTKIIDEDHLPNIMGPNLIFTYGHPDSNRDKMPVGFFGGTGISSNSEGFSRKNLTQLTGVKEYSYGLEQQIGHTYNSINFFTANINGLNPNGQLNTTGNGNNASLYQFSHQILPDDIDPLQGKFLHSSDAIRPYLDPSYLGTGQAEIEFDASNWDEDESVQYRLLFTSGGDVGTAEYKLFKKIVFGYPDNEYEYEHWAGKNLVVLPSQRMFDSNISTRQVFSKRDSFWVEDDTAEFIHTGDDNFDDGLYPNVIKYDKKRLISFSTSGLSIVNIYTDDYFNIDVNSTPSLTTSQINDVIVNELNGEIWVATTDAGLFRISSDFSTVTSISVGTASINDINCKSIDYTNNGDVWAAFEGGLALSTDNGATWTEYNESTTPQFSYAGISDGNWNNLQGIVVDKESSDDRLLIVTQGGKDTSKIVWWSREGSTTTSDAMDSTILANAQDGEDGNSGELHTNSQAFGVSKWVKHFPNSGGTFILLNTYSLSSQERGVNVRYRTIDWGSTSLRATNDENYQRTEMPRMKFLSFTEDSAENTGLFILGGLDISDVNDRWAVRLYDEDLGMLEEWTYEDWQNNYPSSATVSNNLNDETFYIEHMGQGIAVFSSKGSYNVVHRFHSDSAPFGDSKFSSQRDHMWEEYGWDGSNWVLDDPNSKVVHSASEELIDDLYVQFTDTGSPNFVTDEYVDMYTFKGIHNDNATEFSFSIPVTARASSILTDLEQTSVPSSSSGEIVNKDLGFVTNLEGTTESDNIYQVGDIIGNLLHNDSTHVFAFSEITFEGDFSISFKTTKDGNTDSNARCTMGVLPLADKGSSTQYNDPNYFFYFAQDQYNIQSGNLGTNSTLVSNTTISAKSDVYTIERVGTDLNFKINGTNVHTVSGVATDAWVVQASFYREATRTFYDMVIDSYTENGYIVELGDSANSTGVFDPRFGMIEAYLDPVTSSFSIDGIDAPVNIDPHVDPSAGAVTLYSKAGWVKFNSADAGSTISAEYQVLYKFN